MSVLSVNDFNKRKLSNIYIVVYVITKNLKISVDNCIVNKELYILLGIDIMGNRQVVGAYFNDASNNRFWLDKFEDIHSRNVKKIIYFVTPDNRSLKKCIKIVYNGIEIINSPYSITLNINNFFCDKFARKSKNNFKNIFLCDNKQKYLQELELFKESYCSNNIIRLLIEKNKDSIDNYYKYDINLRKLFYPYYAFVDMKKHLNKLNTNDTLCSNLDGVIQFFLSYINAFENGRRYCKSEWLKLLSEIYELSDNVLEEYING